MGSLLKNEYIKIFKKGKNIGIIIAVILMIGGVAFLTKFEENNMKYWVGEGRLINLEESIKYGEDTLKNLESNKEEYPNQKEETIANLEMWRKEVQVVKNKIEGKLKWQDEVKFEIESLEKQKLIAQSGEKHDELHIKNYIEPQIETLKYYLDNNVDPGNAWDFGILSFMRNVFVFLGIGLLIGLLAVFSSDIIAGEMTPATFKFSLVQPVSRGKVLMSKFIAITTSAIGLIVGTEVIVIGIVGAITGFKDINRLVEIGTKYKITDQSEGLYEKIAGTTQYVTTPEYLIKGIGIQILFIIACIALFMLVSVIFKNSTSAMAVTIIVGIAGTVMPSAIRTLGRVAQYNPFTYGNINDILTGDAFHVYDMNSAVTVEMGIIILSIVTIVSLISAITIFKKKDILA